MWTCTVCGREFKRKNQSHFCKHADTVGEYIATFSKVEQAILSELRKLIRDTAPKAEEKISWKMPTYYQHGNIIHFAMHKNHLGLYVGTSATTAFIEELDDASLPYERNDSIA